MTLLQSIGNPDAAIKVEEVYNHMEKGDYRKALENQIFLLTNPDYNEGAACGLGLVLYGCLSKYLAPFIRKFLINQRGQD